MKKLILSLASAIPSMCFAQNAITTYTLVPYSSATTSLNVSVAVHQSNGQTVDYPVNYVYPSFSRDSQKVQWWNASSGLAITSFADSTNHFYTGTHQFLSKDVKGIDSFFHCCMTK